MNKRYPGKPDIVLPKYHTVIFVNGCFWHQHPGCKSAALPERTVIIGRRNFKEMLNVTLYKFVSLRRWGGM